MLTSIASPQLYGLPLLLAPWPAQVQYGYHIASLNSLAPSLICSRTAPLADGRFSLPTCLELSDAEYGAITSAYTVGGLGASLTAGGLVGRYGKRGTAARSAVVLAFGAIAVGFGSSFWILVLGRVLIGMSCGIATVVVPLHLASVAPPAIAGSIGILTQISINVGIFAAQAFSLPLSKPMTGDWRIVQLISAVLALVQCATSPLVPEDGRASKEDVLTSEDEEERAPLASAGASSDEPISAQRRKRDDDADYDGDGALSVRQVLGSADPAISKPLWALVVIMLFQQLSGINAVMYYSTSILTAVNPTSAQMVSLFMTLVNLVMTFPTIFLIERAGRRTLLVSSLLLLSLSTAVLGWSINTDRFTVASVAIIAFVVSFALGLGPVPFVLVGEMPQPEAKSATASIAVAVNWLANLAVGLLFLPLRDALARGHEGETGTVFWVFTGCTAVGVFAVARLLR